MLPFWNRVKRLMEHDLNQAWLCREIGVSKGTLSSWIVNNRIPRADKAVKIANALGVSVPYLVTGSDASDKAERAALVRVVRSAMKERAYVRTPEKREYRMNEQMAVKFIPLFDQAASAGPGTELLDHTEPKEFIPIPEEVIKHYPDETILAVFASGDSMEGANISDGDYIFFAQGKIKGDGIYVLSVQGELLVKRLSFDPILHKLHIYSENPKYPTPTTIDINSEDVRIEGKVVAWTHRHDR